MYPDTEINCFDTQFWKQLHCNFLATRNTQKQRESRESTRASQLRDIDLGIVLAENHQLCGRFYQQSGMNCRVISLKIYWTALSVVNS